jgi:hypothetical protein
MELPGGLTGVAGLEELRAFDADPGGRRSTQGQRALGGVRGCVPLQDQAITARAAAFAQAKKVIASRPWACAGGPRCCADPSHVRWQGALASGGLKMYLVAITADLNGEDQTGCVWTFLDAAHGPGQIHPGAESEAT